jgi:hypothetical protein
LPTTNRRQATGRGPLPRLPSERELYHLWHGQRFPAAALQSGTGRPFRVLHPGRPGRGAGPDFRDAIIAPPAGRVLRGDVELHVRASDFLAHGHGGDRRYDRVALHVVFEDDTNGTTRLRSGRAVPVAALGPWVRRRAEELAAWLAAPALWREPCHDALARLGNDPVLGLLASLGEERFLLRSEAIASHLDQRSPPDVLYNALLEGLAYGASGGSFHQLAGRLPWDALVAAVEQADAPRLDALFAESLDMAPHHGRPANHPKRRAAGLARLLIRHRSLLTAWPEIAAHLARPGHSLADAWTVAGEGNAALIGRERAVELLTNAVLPWAHALSQRREDARTAALALERLAELPRPGRYGALAFLEQNLRPRERGLRFGAREQQGMLALYKTECSKGGCGRCQLS